VSVDVRRAALALADRGWHVHPVEGKRPLTAHGCIDATTDVDVIEAWWRRWPAAGIGVSCGASGLLVVDLDGPAAVDAWRQLRAEAGDVSPATLTSRTGRGWHLYYAQPGGEPLGNTAGRLGHGIDTRGAGGYVVAPPSPHPAGGRYAWATEVAVRPAPPWLVDHLRPKPALVQPVFVPNLAGDVSRPYLRAAVAGELERIVAAQPGGRNHQLNAGAFALGQFVGGGLLDEAAVMAALVEAASACGLALGEAEATSASGLRAGKARPRVVAP